MTDSPTKRAPRKATAKRASRRKATGTEPPAPMGEPVQLQVARISELQRLVLIVGQSAVQLDVAGAEELINLLSNELHQLSHDLELDNHTHGDIVGKHQHAPPELLVEAPPGDAETDYAHPDGEHGHTH